MSKPMRVQFENQPVVLTEIDSPDICPNARFELDKPVAMGEYDVLILNNGQWSLERQDGSITMLNGRWVT